MIEFGTLGDGPPVLLLPGRGGAGTEQFSELGGALAAAGYRAIAINPRGVGLSRGPLEGLTLHDLARDVAAVTDVVGGPVHVVGRALGNRIARCFAADYPLIVKSVCLIAAGGLVPAAPRNTRQKASKPGKRLNHWRQAGLAQEGAARATPLAEWWAGGEAPMLVVQGLDDHIAVPENGRQLQREFPRRVRLREVADAGHLVLFERPEAVIAEVLSFLTEVEEGWNGP